MMRKTVGVPTIINKHGKMHIIIGIASNTGKRAARSSMRA
jgi:hypothetical protein